MIHGKYIYILVNDEVVAACKNTDITTESDLIEVSSPSSGDFKDYIPGRKSWSVSNACLVKNVPALLERSGEVVDIVIASPSEVNMFLYVTNSYMYGSAIVKSVNIGASVDGLATGTIQLQGTGPLTRGEDYTLVNQTTYTVFNPNNRQSTSQTFTKSEFCELSNFSTGAGYSYIAIKGNDFFVNPITGDLEKAKITKLSFKNGTQFSFDRSLDAWVFKGQIPEGSSYFSIMWDFESLIGATYNEIDLYFY